MWDVLDSLVRCSSWVIVAFLIVTGAVKCWMAAVDLTREQTVGSDEVLFEGLEDPEGE